jgi:hypothetical protein
VSMHIKFEMKNSIVSEKIHRHRKCLPGLKNLSAWCKICTLVVSIDLYQKVYQLKKNIAIPSCRNTKLSDFIYTLEELASITPNGQKYYYTDYGAAYNCHKARVVVSICKII